MDRWLALPLEPFFSIAAAERPLILGYFGGQVLPGLDIGKGLESS